MSSTIDSFSPEELLDLLSPSTWLGHATPPEFLDVSGKDLLDLVSQNSVDSFLARRFPGRTDLPESMVKFFLKADINCISHALSALLSIANRDAKHFLPPGIREVIGNNSVQFDHIGVEVFGKLEWYIELISHAYSHLGVNVTGEHVFPSVQVRSALHYDDQLRDVRIARIYLTHGEDRLNLELFEATQCWTFVGLRQASLYAHLIEPKSRLALISRISNKLLEPVGHVAFRVSDARIVESIQTKLLAERELAEFSQVRPYVSKAYFNPAERSTNTKFVESRELPSGQTIESQIVEILSYES